MKSILTEKLLSRKNFIQLALILVTSYLLRFWYQIIQDKKLVLQSLRQKLRIKIPTYPGISFHEAIIIHKQESRLTVMSSKCPHLGCQINKEENQELVCPCHGSRFSLDGELRKGPAQDNLARPTYRLDTKAGEIHVEI